MLDTFLNENIFLRVINSALQLDPQASEKLAALEGKRVAITLEPRDEAWIFRIDMGRLALDGGSARDCDVRLSGNLSGFLHLFKSGEAGAAKSEDARLYIEGDLHTAQTFQRVMGSLSPDFEGVLRERFGDKLGAALAEGVAQLRRVGESGRAQVEARLRVWLDDEFVSRERFLAQAGEIQALRKRLDALEALLNRVEKS